MGTKAGWHSTVRLRIKPSDASRTDTPPISALPWGFVMYVMVWVNIGRAWISGRPLALVRLRELPVLPDWCEDLTLVLISPELGDLLQQI